MPHLVDRVASSRGWRRRGLALAAGLVGALILAPINFGLALVFPMAVAVWLLDGIAARPGWSWRATFGTGWWLGFGYHLAGFWWLGAAFLVDPEFKWLLPLGVIGVPAILAVFTGAGIVVARLLWVPGPARVLALAVGLASSEWARGHWFSGFPWNTFGMALGGRLLPAQLASLCGLDGLNFVAIALAAAPATLTDGGRSRWIAPGAAAVTLAGILVFGTARLSGPPPAPLPDVTIRLVQPGLRPDEDFTFENKDRIVDDYVALSRRDDLAKGVTLADVTMLVWPESPFPFILSRQPEELAKIAALLPPRTSLVTGAAREEDIPAQDGDRAHSDYYNAILVVARGGRILDSYDKLHLVPFGEYLPFDALLRRLGLRNFVAVPGGFEPGRERRALAVPGLPAASPLICYEAIFPGRALTDAGPTPPLPPEHHQRRLVRRHQRSLAAPCPGPSADDRGGTADGARGGHRHLGLHRSIRPHLRIPDAGRGWDSGWQPCRTADAPPLRSHPRSLQPVGWCCHPIVFAAAPAQASWLKLTFAMLRPQTLT